MSPPHPFSKKGRIITVLKEAQSPLTSLQVAEAVNQRWPRVRYTLNSYEVGGLCLGLLRHGVRRIKTDHLNAWRYDDGF